ncbi:inositol monophosphatase family protein [Roseospira visakhapatnamensis]|uniref:Fructose-1,6-bisphosphatase/inositol monophosphatase family enzyme n=1 Tax=Roseospira visakhapatnamensis TaxID=390880 RepID=A0A7W6RB79_9PROT|nr:inositol monophosphatase family protein [Roseospira visakhapatnamensis]MBB4265331.1 fructose-1,6-bisphosphatase/inositol monophosphatase family enzyme [Roseospira visakhapatnamensis]
MTQFVSMTAVAAVLDEVAATEILPRFRNLADTDIHAKSSSEDLVTLADIEAERALTRRLPDLLPGSVVVGEEAVYADRAVLDRLSGDRPVWVVDPVDGTGNFSRGEPAFGVIVALVHRGETVAGWILDPLAERLAMAELGAGATVNGQPARVTSPPGPLDAFRGCAFGPRERALRGHVRTVPVIRSAAQVYLRLVTNDFQFAAFSRLMPWDHAAGVLIHAEAGGYGRLIDGSAYAPTLRAGDIVFAPDKASWTRMTGLMGARVGR